MTLRIIEISAPNEAAEHIAELAEKHKAIDMWHFDSQGMQKEEDKDERETFRILIDVKNQQELMDDLTKRVRNEEKWRILLIPVEATIPVPDNPQDNEQANQKKTAERASKANGEDHLFGRIKYRIMIWASRVKLHDFLSGSVSREELQEDVASGSRLSAEFMLLILLSSIVAGIGLIQSDVAVIIGAMVIAPLLGPNLAISFAAALGDKKMLFKAVVTNLVALAFAIGISAIAGFFISDASVTESQQLMNRTNINYASIALAMAAGGAAVLSLTTGVSSALVGVMVAVALLPPAVALGFTLGNFQWNLAFGTGLLLATNIVCINLAGLTVFRLKGIKPRTWYEKENAKKAIRNNAIIWVGILLLLIVLIFVRNKYLVDQPLSPFGNPDLSEEAANNSD